MGKKRSTIANYMRLLKLDPIIQTGIRDGFVSMGHGRALVNVDSKEDQIKLYEKIIGENLSVRDTEQAVRIHQQGGAPTKNGKTKTIPDFAKQGMGELTDHLEVKVAVNASEKGKGKIAIPFNSQEEFQRIKKMIIGG